MTDDTSLSGCFGGCFQDRTVLVTGHTGFKGSWLCLWLEMMGARVIGYSLESPTTPNHYSMLHRHFESHIGDVRDFENLHAVMQQAEPDVVIHLAAQALVRHSYAEPRQTYTSNVIGSINVLEAARDVPGIEAILCVTSDKVYQNLESDTGYIESDRLAGSDPYSCSKACAELVVNSYRESWFNDQNAPQVATARAGNVIGGGDWSPDRLVPDAVKAAASGKALQLRNPAAIRPWQHVLEPLAGYLVFVQRLLEGNRDLPPCLNFGPGNDGNVRVADIVDAMQQTWPECHWERVSPDEELHETGTLKLNSELARKTLDWQPVWDWKQSVDRTTRWYRDWYQQGNVGSTDDLYQFVDDARMNGMRWAA